jgi:hypothetical protein
LFTADCRTAISPEFHIRATRVARRTKVAVSCDDWNYRDMNQNAAAALSPQPFSFARANGTLIFATATGVAQSGLPTEYRAAGVLSRS